MACKECMYKNILCQKRTFSASANSKEKGDNAQMILDRQKKEKEMDIFQKTQQSFLPCTVKSSEKWLEKTKLPETSFWIPSKIPDEPAKDDKSTKREIVCPFGEDHPLQARKLITVKFSTEGTGKICPSCRKTLTNSFQIVLLRKCGHVICKVCSDKVVKLSKKCFVCEEDVKEKDVISMHNEGSGFSSTSKVEVKRSGIAFKA